MPIYFGDKIKEARKAAGLTQRQLAEKINVTSGSICNWEKNLSRPDPDTIQNLCWALGVQPNFFFGESNSSSSIPFELTPDADLMRRLGKRLSGADGSDFRHFLNALCDADPDELRALARFAQRLAAEYENADGP